MLSSSSGMKQHKQSRRSVLLLFLTSGSWLQHRGDVQNQLKKQKPGPNPGPRLRMKPQISSLFSLLFFLLLPRPLLFYSLKNCTIDLYDQSIIDCDKLKLSTIPSDVPKCVTHLSLYNNHIKRIRQTDLTGFTRLVTINMRDNEISHIEEGAFSNSSALTWLNLFNNKLTNLTDDMFKGLSNLLILDLSCNQIESISKFAFEPLKELQEVYLWENQISDIVNIVSHCPSLNILDLAHNNLTSLESNLFQFPLLNLTELHIGSDSLTLFSVHSDVFPHLEYLELSETGPEFEWDISDKAFLKSLKTLHLSWNNFTIETYQLIFQSVDSAENLLRRGRNIELIDQGLLDFACGIPSLRNMTLVGDEISLLNDTLLQSCTNLSVLHFVMNLMRGLSEFSLRMLTRLTQLTIQSNELSRIPVAIRNMSTLTYLSFEENHIREIQCYDFLNLTTLTELNLKSNKISNLNSCAFKDLQSLKILDVENNFLLQFDNSFGVTLAKLVVLNAKENNIGWLQNGVFRNMSCLTDLNLKTKAVTIVEDGAFEGLFNLKRLTYSQNRKRTDIEGLEQVESLVVFLTNMETTNLTVYEPLTFKGFYSLQELIIKVDKNICFYNSPISIFYGFHNLQIFSFDSVCCDTTGLFWNIPNLINLQIINCVSFIVDFEHFRPFPDLKFLDLSHSKIESLDFLIEANLTKLEKLILVNSELVVINETVLEALPSLKYLDLSGNPFACNCSNVGFIEWAIRNKQVQVVHAFQHRCSSPLSEDGHFLLDFDVQSCWEFPGFLCFISSSALVLFTLLSSFIYHFLRWQLVYGFYLLLAFLYDSKKRRQGCPHIYDAFVSYNVHDEAWVYGELLPELEGRQGWRLCLHHRDFQPGKPIIENITDSIYSSRKTLCVISRRYLQSEWCSREIQMASFRLFDEQKDVLILLFLEEISSNQLSPFYRMRKLVKSRTYLSWTQARSHNGLFWEKVRRALESGNEPGDNHNPLTANI